MKCYYHPTTDAVAMCKSCSRALCLDCSADVHPGTACKGRCEMEVAELNTLIQRGKTAYQKTGKAYKRNSVALLLMGFIFCAVGLVPILTGHGYGSAFMAVMGAVFLMWAYLNYNNGRQIQEVEKSRALPSGESR